MKTPGHEAIIGFANLDKNNKIRQVFKNSSLAEELKEKRREVRILETFWKNVIQLKLACKIPPSLY